MVWKTNFSGDEPTSSAPKPSKREHVHKFTRDSNVVSAQPGKSNRENLTFSVSSVP